MSNTKEVRLSDLIFEFQNVEHTKDWYDLTRACYECALMEQYAESVQFVAENADSIFDDDGDNVFEEGVFFEAKPAKKIQPLDGKTTSKPVKPGEKAKNEKTKKMEMAEDLANKPIDNSGLFGTSKLYNAVGKKKQGIFSKAVALIKRVWTAIVNFFKKIFNKLDATTVSIQKIKKDIIKNGLKIDKKNIEDFCDGLFQAATNENGEPLIELAYPVPDENKYDVEGPAIGKLKSGKLVEQVKASRYVKSTEQYVRRVIAAALMEQGELTVAATEKNGNRGTIKVFSRSDGKEIGIVQIDTLCSQMTGLKNKNDSAFDGMMTTFNKEWAQIKSGKTGFNIPVDKKELNKIIDRLQDIQREIGEVETAATNAANTVRVDSDPNGGAPIISNTQETIRNGKITNISQIYPCLSMVTGNIMSLCSNYITFRDRVVKYLDKNLVIGDAKK